MQTKFLEIRDVGTRIPIMAFSTKPSNLNEHDFWRATGFGESSVIIVRPDDQMAFYDAYAWNNARTMRNAHRYIQEHFDELENFSVVDVRVILGEATEPAKSEIWKLDDSAEYFESEVDNG